MKNIAVVILNWNGRKLLEQFLPSVVTHSKQAHIYVADNNSNDDSLTFVSEHYPEITLIRNSENFGFAQGYNLALKQVTEPYWVLLNSDVEVSKDWLNSVEHTFERYPETAILQPKLLDYKNKTYFEYAGAAGGFIDKYAFPFCRGRIFSSLEEDHKQYDDESLIFWASGACFIIRKNVFETLGGFDVDFFAHQEEIDLCWRAFNQDYHIRFLPESTVYHLGGATLKEGSTQKTFLNFRNSILMLLKNHPKKGLFTTFFIRLCLDGIAGFFLLLQGKPSHTWAIVRAHFSVYAQINTTLLKRQANQKSHYFHRKSIVVDYYLFGKRLFSSLK